MAKPAYVPKQAPIRRRRLYEEVALRIEEMIREGRFEVGDSLPAERELMAELGVGRSAVREALASLARMGLVSVNSGERARVTAPTARSSVSRRTASAFPKFPPNAASIPCAACRRRKQVFARRRRAIFISRWASFRKGAAGSCAPGAIRSSSTSSPANSSFAALPRAR